MGARRGVMRGKRGNKDFYKGDQNAIMPCCVLGYVVRSTWLWPEGDRNDSVHGRTIHLS